MLPRRYRECCREVAANVAARFTANVAAKSTANVAANVAAKILESKRTLKIIILSRPTHNVTAWRRPG